MSRALSACRVEYIARFRVQRLALMAPSIGFRLQLGFRQYRSWVDNLVRPYDHDYTTICLWNPINHDF